tara:strand:+ start:328 stop:831 length:504 start_codon:yes stop_codon:yes gene_type:complete
MGQEFFINSQALQDKVSQLLPSQGGAGAGFDLSASTQIIPVINLTETASGSSLRQDLQVSVDNATTRTFANNNTQVAVSSTGFYQVYVDGVGTGDMSVDIYDGTTANLIRTYNTVGGAQRFVQDNFVVFLSAGLSLRVTSANGSTFLSLYTRQIADITGNLTNPLSF